MSIKGLAKPYPFVANSGHQLRVSLAFGLFVYLFLLFFQPFGLGDMNFAKSLYVLGFGMITALVMFLNFMLGSFLLPQAFDEDGWTIKNEILFGLWNILLISLANQLYNTAVTGSAFRWELTLLFVLVTVSVGVFPLTILVFFRELYLRDRSQKEADQFNQRIGSEKANEEGNSPTIVLKENPGQRSLSLKVEELQTIRASDNYCQINFQREGENSSDLLRLTLKECEMLLSEHPQIFRCHRSYLVNRSWIKEISGNARAYTLHLHDVEEEIPVSRSIDKNLLAP